MLLPLRSGGLTGTDPQLQAASVGGDTVEAGGRTYLLLRNTSATLSRTATIASFFPPVPGAAPASVVIAVPPLGTRLFGPFNNFQNLRNPADGLASITYDNNADLILAHVG